MADNTREVIGPPTMARIIKMSLEIKVASWNKVLEGLEGESIDFQSGEIVVFETPNAFEMAALIVKQELFDQLDLTDDPTTRLRIQQALDDADDLFWMSVNERIDTVFLDGELYGAFDLREGGMVVAIPAREVTIVASEPSGDGSGGTRHFTLH
ncbi:MAG: hypothetical protein WC457_01770 [Patescibacteria group bacterium]